jgi:hypothetical protein
MVGLMDARKFKRGQRVVMVRGRAGGAVPGTFEIVRPLPESGRSYQYCIRSVTNGHERVADEAELQVPER